MLGEGITEERRAGLRGGLAGRAVAALALAALLLALLGSERGRAAEPLFGFNESWHAFGDDTGRAAYRSSRAGADSNRISVEWRFIEPIEGQRDWSPYDRPYDRMRDQGQRPILTVMSAPCWAAADPECAPGNPPPPPDAAHMEDWTEFIQALILRYPDISALQVWNEPNHGKYWADPNPDRYVAVLEAANEAAQAVAPDLPVVVGGMSPARMRHQDGIRWRPFLRRIFKQGARTMSDGFAVHLYPRTSALRKPGRKVVRGVTRQLRNARRIVRKAGGGKPEPTWVTEFGISTDREAANSVGLKRQARLLRRVYRSFRARGAASVIIHRLVDIDGASAWESGLGVMHSLSNPKPAFRALRTIRLRARR